MQRYKDLGGKSGVAAYEIGDTYIDVEFNDGRRYRYDSSRPGTEYVDKMKDLAIRGAELATFINKNVRKRFSLRLR